MDVMNPTYQEVAGSIRRSVRTMSSAAKGAAAFVRKAIGEQKKGKTSVIVLPVFDYVTMLLEAGAEIRPLRRVPFLDVDSRRAAPHPPNIACFILRPIKL